MNRIKNLQDHDGPLIVMVPVPIGNDADISLRALDTLKRADLICCEDTRTTAQLLARYDIHPQRLVSLYSQVEGTKAPEIVASLKGTQQLLAYCSDAGTPGISDPGALLVRTAIDAGIPVTALPGPCALVTALVISGLDTADFAFYGFLSDKRAARVHKLEELAHVEIPMIFYESPVRALDTLKDMYEVLGDRRFALLRELTKTNEEAIRGQLSEAADLDPASIRGECVIVVDGFKKTSDSFDAEIEKLYRLYADNGISPSLSAKLIAAQLGLRKNEVYRIVQRLDRGPQD